MNKYLRIQMKDGTRFDIPAIVIAEHRAGFFESNSAEKLTYHASSIQPRLHSAEMEFALNNDNILIDWATKKMTWKELAPHAKKVEGSAEDYEHSWDTAQMDVVSF